MNPKFTFGSIAASHQENLELLSPTIRFVPILNEAGHPVDMVSWAELWRLPVTEPSLGGNEMKYVSDCIASVWISSQGGYIQQFQEAFLAFQGEGEALCTSSGTAALHLALKALDVGPGDEVIVPDITFGACPNTVLHCGAKPVFVDIDPVNWTMDPVKLEAAVTPETKVVMPVHLYGHPCDMDPIMDIARRHSLKVVEDCAEALGAEYKGRKVGTIGDIGCFSFFANKVITTGEGGMVLALDKTLVARMKMLRDHGMDPNRRYWHLEPGFNFRMTNLQAALGLAQMERIDDFLRARRAVVGKYDEILSGVGGLGTPTQAEWARNIYWLYSIEIDPDQAGIDRNQLAARLSDVGIDTRPVFPALHQQPAYGSGGAGEFPVSEKFGARGLSLPTANGMSIEDAERVGEAVVMILAQEISRRPHMAVSGPA